MRKLRPSYASSVWIENFMHTTELLKRFVQVLDVFVHREARGMNNTISLMNYKKLEILDKQNNFKGTINNNEVNRYF